MKDRPWGWRGKHSRLEVFSSRWHRGDFAAVQVAKCRNWPKETIRQIQIEAIK